MSKPLPAGVKLARILNIIQATLGIAFLIPLVLVGIAMVGQGEVMPGKDLTRLITTIVIYVAITLIAVWLVINLGKLNPSARRIQIIFSILNLLNFPIGTILHAIILFSMFRPATKEAFGIVKT
jgi:hypothetical protein